MKSHFPITDLGIHVQQISTRNRSDAEIEVFSVTNSEGFTRSIDYFSKEVFSKDVSNYKVVKPGQFAYNPSRINVGSIDYLRHHSSVLVSPLYIVFESDKAIHADYLLRYLKSEWGNVQIRGNTEGAVRDSLKYAGLEKIKLPFPSLSDQIRIAHLLGKVEGLIAQRKQHLQQLDDLLKSVFLEMFGDPVRNEKGWEILPLGSISEVQGGLQVTSKRNVNPLEVPYLRVANVYRDRLNLTEIKTIRVTEAELERVRLRKGDLLIVEGHGNPDEIGRSAVWDGSIENCVHQNHLIRVRVDISIITELYTSFFINSAIGRAQMFKASKTTSGLNTISSKNVKETQIPIPGISLQNQFTSIVEKVEGIKSRYQQSLNDLESLYGALSQQAFKGGLDLSRVPLPIEHTQQNTDDADTSTSVKINIPLSDFFHIPQAADTAKVRTPEGRTKFLKTMLSAWLEQFSHKPFSLTGFMGNVQNKLWDLTDGELHLNTDDYDQIKNWLFDALKAEKLEQAYDDNNNRIQLKPRSAKGKLA